MNATLVHRGPDDSGVLSGDGWALAMCRLAVQDLSAAGHQPMQRGDLAIVFNGEVYNFPELRSELERDGLSFSSGTDTEVVLRAFERWGVDSYERLNGMFASVIVSRAEKRAWLARDRFGKKPLFYARLAGRLLVASELKAIVASAGNELSLDRQSLAQFFRYQYVPSPRSIFEQVRKLGAGSWMEVDLSTGMPGPVSRYWQLSPPGDGLPATPEETHATIRASVKRRMISDVPVGAFLSGGIDSSLVVGCMRELADEVRTFTIGFENPLWDESRYAADVARYFDTRHTQLTLTEREGLEIVPTLPEFYDEPFADSSAIPTVAVSRLARQDVTVALSGDGGDELFGGYTRYRYARFLHLPVLAPSILAGSEWMVSGLPFVGNRAAVLASLTPADTLGGAYRDLVSVWRSRELAKLMPDSDPAFDPYVCDFDNEPGSLLVKMMRADARTYLVDDILQKVDRASMSVSLEARNPLLDPEVAALAMRSTSLAERDMAGKALLRQTLRRLLPDRLIDRPKMGFGVPIGHWMRTDLRPMLEDLVLSRRDPEYSRPVAQRVCAEHLSGERDRARMVWALLVYELWRNRWVT